MTTSLTNTEIIEKYIEGKLKAGEKLLFEVKLLLNPELKSDLFYQKKTRRLLRLYQRKKLKEEIAAIGLKIFSDPRRKSFHYEINRIFNLPES